jgi:Flp pilus assembly protein TadB
MRDSKLKNPLARFRRWFHAVLYEETDDPHLPSSKPRKILHSSWATQAWIATSIVIAIPTAVAVALILELTGSFAISYVVCVFSAGLIIYIGRYNEKRHAKRLEQKPTL